MGVQYTALLKGKARRWVCGSAPACQRQRCVTAATRWWAHRLGSRLSDGISGTAGDLIKNMRKLPASLQKHSLLCNNLSNPKGMAASLGEICIPTSLPHLLTLLKSCRPSLGHAELAPLTPLSPRGTRCRCGGHWHPVLREQLVMGSEPGLGLPPGSKQLIAN